MYCKYARLSGDSRRVVFRAKLSNFTQVKRVAPNLISIHDV